MHVPFLLSRIKISSLLLGIVLSVRTLGSLPSQLVYTNFVTWSYRCLLHNFTPISFHMLQCSSAHTVSCLCMYSFLPVLDTPIDMFHCLIKLFIFCICCLFLFVIFLSRDILFVVPDLVQILFHFQSVHSDLPPTATAMCLLHQ